MTSSKRWTKSAITYLQAENEKLKHALGVAQRIRKKDKLAHHEFSSEEENGGGTVGLNENDSDPEVFDNNVNPEDDKFTLGDGRSIREKRSPSTPCTGVLGISNDRMVNIHLNSNRRGSLDSATFTSEQMQQFICNVHLGADATVHQRTGCGLPLTPICRRGHDIESDRASGKRHDHHRHVGAEICSAQREGVLG